MSIMTVVPTVQPGMSSPTPTLGARIRELRERRDLNQDEVAHRLRGMGIEVGVSALWQIEQGRIMNPRAEILLGLAEVLNATDADLPEAYLARLYVALGIRDRWGKSPALNLDLEDDALDAAIYSLNELRRARRRGEQDGRRGVVRAAGKVPAAPEGRKRAARPKRRTS